LTAFERARPALSNARLAHGLQACVRACAAVEVHSALLGKSDSALLGKCPSALIDNPQKILHCSAMQRNLSLKFDFLSLVLPISFTWYINLYVPKRIRSLYSRFYFLSPRSSELPHPLNSTNISDCLDPTSSEVLTTAAPWPEATLAPYEMASNTGTHLRLCRISKSHCSIHNAIGRR